MENKENHYVSPKEIIENDNNSAVLYERSRIKALAEQREGVQKKTFTKWVNSHLAKSKEKYIIEDLYTDLQDGKALLKLLEILSGEKMPPITKGKLRIHCIENVTKSIKFLSDQHVYLESLGAHDIVDGNPTLILGLIWTIILRFQIQNATIDESDGKKTSKESLLLWCQMKTAGYNNVNIRNFTSSWKDGLAFNAILHKHRPEVVDYITLSKANPVENLNNAFDIAEREFGVPQLLDTKDIIVDQPDEKSIMTYVGELCLALNQMKSDEKQVKRLANVIAEAIATEDLISDYEDRCDTLLQWINEKIHWMKNEPLRESLPGVKEQLAEFTAYRCMEKPPKFEDRGLLEMKFFEIQSKLRADNRKLYVAPEGKLISDINRAWDELEKCEHQTELKLYEELIRQQKLDQLGNHFNRKAQMREAWLVENDVLVHKNIFGDDLVTVVAAIKKHEALEGDIFAHEDRINALGFIADDLRNENYYKIDEVANRYEQIVSLWRQLLKDLDERRDKLDRCRHVQIIMEESDYLLDWAREIANRLGSRDFGKHLLGVDNLLEKHKILASDMRNLETRIHDTTSRLEAVDCERAAIEPAAVSHKIDELERQYKELIQLAERREHELHAHRTMWLHIEQIADHKEWAKEIIQLVQNPNTGHDLQSVERMMRKFDQIVADVGTRRHVIDEDLTQFKQHWLDDQNDDETHASTKRHDDSPRPRQLVDNEIDELQTVLAELDERIAQRQNQLDRSHELHQLLADIDDLESMALEQCRLFANEDVGDNLAITEFYLKQYKQQLDQLEQLDRAHAEISQRKSHIDNGELDEACRRLDADFSQLHKLADQRLHLLKNNLEKFHLLANFDAIHDWIAAKDKLLVTLVPGEEFNELNEIKHRFDCFEDEMKINSAKISETNNSSKALINDQHPESEFISAKQNELNSKWNKLADIAETKKKELQLALDYNQFMVKCQETRSWISDKMQVLRWTDELKDDLDGIMQLQRRLGSLQRDVQAIEAIVNYLNHEAEVLKRAKPREEQVIDSEMTSVNEMWEELKIMLQDRDDRLNSSNELQKFFKDLDTFNNWLKNVQIQVATQDIPDNLQEAEKLCIHHLEIKDDIECWEPEYVRLLDFGRQVSHSKDDPQYVLFNERLNLLENEWEALHKMWQDKNISLEQSRDAQTFIRDSLQVDGILTKQETFLTKTDLPTNYEAAESADREFETFKSSVLSNQPKIDHVVQFGNSLILTNVLSDRIRLKCEQIIERCTAIQAKILKRDENLKDNVKLQLYFEDVMDLEEWIAEKMITVSDTSYREDKDISTRYNRFRDFEHELEANKDRMDEVIADGQAIIKDKPHLKDEIEPRIEHLQLQWEELLLAAKDKSSQLEEANREVIFDESTKSMISWVTEISSQIITTEEVTEEYGLVEINEKLKDQHDKDKQFEQKRKMLNDIQQHAEKLKEQYPDREEEFETIQKEVKVRLTEVEAPMAQRRDKLSLQKRVQQFLRDLADEREWILERIDLLTKLKMSPDSLQTCLQKIRRLKTLATEIDNHVVRIEDLNREGHDMIENNHPNSDKFEIALDELNKLWKELIIVCEDCQLFFDDHREVQEYLFDANESEYWMSEREFDLLREDKAKDEGGALNAMRKHDELISVINNYGSVLSSLGERYHSILNRSLPHSQLVAQKQERVDKMYATLLEMCLEKKLKIEDLIQFYHLLRSIQSLEEWIEERRIVATSNEVGSELEHCLLLRERFSEFAIETNEIGSPRVTQADEMCDRLINLGHQDAPEIAQWKDRINEAWADLLELIETRIQLLKAAHDFFKFMSDSSELLDLINEKIRLIPEAVGKDANTVAAAQRKHHAFATEIERLEPLIQNALTTADHLMPLYSGDREQELQDRKTELLHLWRQLKQDYSNRENALMDASDLYKFYAMIRELLAWMSEIEIQINIDDKARDVCGVELIMSNHRSLKAEIDSRDENRTICVTLGRTLLNRKHPKRNDIRKKCVEVLSKHFNIMENWRDRQDFLEMILEVYQFAREAAVAEAWLIGQESQFNSNDFGDTLNEIENLLQKHSVLERNLAIQDERFESLRKLTSFEERNNSLTDQKKTEKDAYRHKRLNDLIEEFRTPPPTPELIRRSPQMNEDVIVPSAMEKAHSSLPIDEKIESRSAKLTKESPKSTQQPSTSSPIEERRTGNLVRKHEWEHATKKAGNRKWIEMFVVIDNGRMSFYKDRKHFEDEKKQHHTYKNEKPLDLVGAMASPAVNYKKRQNVLRMKLSAGGEYLFECANSADMDGWVKKINEISGVDPSATRYNTLPNMRTGFEQPTESADKRKLTTLGRKK